MHRSRFGTCSLAHLAEVVVRAETCVSRVGLRCISIPDSSSSSSSSPSSVRRLMKVLHGMAETVLSGGGRPFGLRLRREEELVGAFLEWPTPFAIATI